MSLPERVRSWLLGLAAEAACEALAERRRAAASLSVAAGAMGAACADLEAALRAVEDRIEAARPFRAETTVHRAWARHPGAPGVFARYHLLACPECPVGADETLAELALGYRVPLDALLDQLNALLV